MFKKKLNPWRVDFSLITVSLCVISLLLLFSIPARASDADEEKDAPLNGWIKLEMQHIDNIYSQESNPSSDWVQVRTLGAEFKPRSSDALEIFFSAEGETRSFNRYPDEDQSELKLSGSYRRRLRGGYKIGAQADYDRQWVGSQAYSTSDLKTWGLDLDIGSPADKNGYQVTLGAGLGGTEYPDFPEFNSWTRKARAEITLPFANYASAAISYDLESERFPDYHILDDNFQLTQEVREDDTNRFTATFSNIFSIFPVTYGQLSVSDQETGSNSTEIDFNTGLVIHNYDENRMRSLSLFGYREFNRKDSLAVYLYWNKTQYSNRPALASDGSSLDQNREDKLFYLYGKFSRAVGDATTVGLEYTSINNDSNSWSKSYNKNTLSFFIESKFK